MNRRTRRGRKGVALLYAVLGSFTAAGLVAMLLGISVASDKRSQARRMATQAQYLADGAIEAAKKRVQTAVANFSAIPSSGTVTIDGHVVPYVIRTTGFSTVATDNSGIQTLVDSYEISADVEQDGFKANAYSLVNATATPLYQYAVFYNSDLEINPGPDMTLGGRVHTNGNMYLNCGGTLAMNTNYVRAVGGIYRNRKDSPSTSEGTVRIREWVQNPFDTAVAPLYTTLHSRSQLASMGITSTTGYDSNFRVGYDAENDGNLYGDDDMLGWVQGALEYWDGPDADGNPGGHTVMSGDHGVGEAVVPSSNSIAMFEPTAGGDYVLDASTGLYTEVAMGTGTHSMGYYHQNAGLSIIGTASGGWRAYDASGTDITTAVLPAVTVRQIYDTRQANSGSGKVRVIELDLALLQLTGKFPTNGLIYSSHYGLGTGTNAKGIKLKNGAVLPRALTVVSDGAVYVQGDYNVGNASKPKVGAAVIADAVNLLSNAWNDTKAPGSGNPVASATTYNCAMVAGNTETLVGKYNGGLENLPRFHENWSNKVCTIRGCLVNTWYSRYATGTWGVGYSAPKRNWTYDTDFNSVSNLPPFTPMAVAAENVVSW